MHKNQRVADLTLSTGGRLLAADVMNQAHMPVGTYSDYPALTTAKLQRWMETRTIPGERQGKDRIEKTLGCSINDAMLKSMGVRLTDCYWFKDEHAPGLTWKDVNYHDNGFSQEIASVAIYGNETPVVDFWSPDLTTDGLLKKAWVISLFLLSSGISG